MPSQPDRVRSIFFGLSADNYAQGRTPACAINASNLMVEVHKHANDNGLTYLLADVKGVNIAWRTKEEKGTFTHGNNPSVALNDNNVVVVMNDIDKKLQYSIGTVRDNTLGFAFTGKEFPGNQPAAKDPSVSVNRAGMLLEVHEQGNDIYMRRGTLSGENPTWPANAVKLVDNGSRPFISVNNTGTIFVTFQRANAILYLIGTYNVNAPAGAITWGQPEGFENGERATVVVTDQNLVFITWTRDSQLFRINGAYVNSRFEIYTALRDTTRAFFFDKGTEPQIASNGSVAIQTHASGNDLLTNASLIFDRANWMSDNRTKLITKSLKDIALPGSHDSGANTDNRARTQTFSIFDQLLYGIRYFDIRPYYSGSKTTMPIDKSKLVAYHTLDVAQTISPFGGTFEGQTIESIAADVRAFLKQHKELVILRISQFRNFNEDVYAAMEQLIRDSGLVNNFYTPETTVTGRLAERKLDQFLKVDRGTVLIVVDIDTNNGDIDYLGTFRASSGELIRPSGFFRYRDWFNAQPDVADITVFDLFSDTPNFDTMTSSQAKDTKHPGLPGSTNFVQQGQIPKFHWFDGFCQGTGDIRSTTPCDLFVLSWQVTPNVPFFEGSPLSNSDTSNKNLVGYLARPENAGPNSNGRDINLLYTDGVESSRSPDVAMVRNKLP